MINKTAGCFCGENKFNVLLDEKPRVFNCHCIDCRKKIGGIISIIQLRENAVDCLLYTSPSPRDGLLSRMPSSA